MSGPNVPILGENHRRDFVEKHKKSITLV